MRRFFSQTSQTLFPSFCFNCKQEGPTLCTRCLMHTARSVETPFIYCTSYYSFQDPLIKRAIHAIKYYHRKDLITPLTERLVDQLKEIIKDTSKKWVLVPIPMPRFRKYMRGYNQALLIAENLGAACQLPVNKNILFRVRSPKRQVTSHSRHDRLHNQHDSFSTYDATGLSIILVDDVTTTGATIAEARKTLIQKGATEVQAITLAH